MKLSKIFIVILFSTSQLLAQDIGTTEVRVVEGFIPTIPEASRLNEKAAFADTIKKVRTQEYAVVETDLKSNYKTRPLKAAKVKADKIAQLYATKVGLGFGNAWTTKASIVHNSKRSKTLSYGILLNHFANKYKVPLVLEGSQPEIPRESYLVRSSKNTLHLYGKKISASHIYMANLNYDRRTALFWGENPALTAEENYRNRFAYTKLSFSAISKDLAADKLKHHTTFFVSDLNELSENQIHLSTNLSKTINGFPFSLEIELNDYLLYNNLDTRFESTDIKSLSFSPFTVISKYGIDFDLAVDIDFMSDDSQVGFFPQIKATKELVKDILLVYGGMRHNEQRHTIKSLSDENPYIHSFGINQSILSGNDTLQHLKITDMDELYVAMRNVLGKDEVFEGSVAYGSVQNFAHFVGVANGTYNRFLVDYIDVKQLHINVNYDRKLNNIISLSINADYYKWDKEVYHKPNFNCDVSTLINLRNKIKVTPSLSYIGNRQAKINSDSALVSIYPSFKNLPAQFHMNLGVYYNYTKNISAYLKLNNLTNSKQDVWIDYREVGFNGLFGLNYSF
ncbi:MAG: hypothetical protein ACI8ZH_001109 [Flavobacteriales bacterium]|jgi:hypothetical protein